MKTPSDFADWLSPMVVKELRQGMRSRLFVISFLLVQGAMILVALIGLALSANHQPTTAVTGFFWTIIGVPLLLVMPLSGLNTVAIERRANTLELVFLTRLTARRILAGKWLALLAQTALLVCAVLPYAVLRYFLGGVDVGTELITIAALLFSSALFSGIAVGLSPQLSRLARGLLGIVIFLSLQFIYPLVSFFLLGMGGPVVGRSALDPWSSAGLLLFALLVLFLMWEFGASKIAPAAENHSSSRRLIGLSGIAIAVTLGTKSSLSLLLLRVALVFLLPILIGALCETPSGIASLYRPFVRRGFLGKLAGRFLYPGWPSGVFYCVLVLLLISLPSFLLARRSLDPTWFWWTSVSFAGALLMPAALIHMRARWRWPPALYLGIQIICALLALLASMLSAYKSVDLRPLFAMIPATGLILIQTGAFSGDDIIPQFIGASVVTFGSFCLLLLQMRKPWREMRALEKIAALPSPRAYAHAPLPAAAE